MPIFLEQRKILYKPSYDGVLRKRVHAIDANQLMSEVHEGSSGPHISIHMLAKKIHMEGYYYLTMEKDCFQHV